MYLGSLITLATIVFSMLKITSRVKIFWETGPRFFYNLATILCTTDLKVHVPSACYVQLSWHL